jgi:hypothetical protein
MRDHYHATIEHILLYGVSAIIVINLVRIGAAKLGTMDGAMGAAGRSIGALVTFGGTQ